MSYIKFNKNNKSISGRVVTIAKNIVQIVSDEGIYCKGGFLVYKDREMSVKIGDYSDYQTIYKPNGFFSNDKTTYPTITPEPVNKPIRELVTGLENEILKLNSELTDTQIALCDVYELLI